MSPVYADHPFSLIRTPVSQMPADSQGDVFDHAASEMALVHNMMVRGLNSIYLQAPYITEADAVSFSNYMAQWYNLLHIHHTGEETDFFPHVERLAGVKGLMEGNVDQHHAFHDGLEAFATYAKACASGKDKYDGAKVVSMIDGFAPALVQHLSDEIPTIQGLKKYAEQLKDLPKLMEHEAEKNMKALGMATGLEWCMMNLDVNYEDGIWASWPPMPKPVAFLLRNVTYWIHRDWWKFSSCDRSGNMRPLYACPENKAS